jgi:4a-hydroxytetrahydrobiopterin dehydratase
LSDLSGRSCKPCEGGVAPLTAAAAQTLMSELARQWQLAADARSIRREFKFKDFYRTMSFVNALAHVANIEDHHPDLEVGYNYCRVLFTTHAIGGLSENDFICAAKIDRIALPVPPAAAPR